MKRSFFIAGNWKMNPDSLDEAEETFALISRGAAKARRTLVMIAPPAPFIAPLAKPLSKKGGKRAADKRIRIAVQDVSNQVGGAFTGSVSAQQARSAGAEYAIVGHSERRAAGDSDAIIAEKAKRALEAGMRVILCVGESERDGHARYFQTVREQVLAVFGAVSPKQARFITVAYEPVWAVGKSYGTMPKPSDIHEMTIYIRKAASEAIGKKAGLAVPVLYGGSVDIESAGVVLREASVDGLLIGRQSLDAEAFGKIIAYADEI